MASENDTLSSCSEAVFQEKAQPCIMVIFGASGDLTRRKLLPALFNLERDGLLGSGFAVVGFARTKMDDTAFRRGIEAAIREFGEGEAAGGDVLERFLSRLHYVSGGYDEQEAYHALARKIAFLKDCCNARRVLYYLSLPPGVAETVLRAYPNIWARCAGRRLRAGQGERRRRCWLHRRRRMTQERDATTAGPKGSGGA